MKKILIVDDEKDIVELLEMGLRRHGFEVIVAYDGEEALMRIKEGKPDFVVLDIMLPKVSGLEVLRQVKTNTPEIFVVLATAKSEVEDIKDGYSFKADYYVTKPYAVDEIVKGIHLLSSLGAE
ncbi:MAG: response regulator [Candidatus Omnitrophota bacterium]